MANSCQYYIKKTNAPRICKKSGPLLNAFTDQGMPHLHMCNSHFWMVQREIVNTVGGPNYLTGARNRIPCGAKGFNFARISSQWDEFQLVQMYSLLQFHMSTFKAVISTLRDGTSRPSPINLVDEVLLIGEMSEGEVLNRKFEEAKNDGRYIDLTENSESVSAERQIECPVCLETAPTRNSTFLNCAHSLCTDCLTNIERRNIPQKCPICRLPF